MKKFLVAAFAALLLASCTCTDCENKENEAVDSLDLYAATHKITTDYAYADGHVYALYSTPSRWIGVDHDPECSCCGGTHKDADTIQTFMEDKNIRINRFRNNGHIIMVFDTPNKWIGTVHDPNCPHNKTVEQNQDDLWNTEIEIDW